MGLKIVTTQTQKFSAQSYGWLFRLASRVLKSFALGLFGFGSACLISIVFGAGSLVAILLSFIWPWLVRLAVAIICLLAVAIVVESIR